MQPLHALHVAAHLQQTTVFQHKAGPRSRTSMIDTVRKNMFKLPFGDASVNDSHERKKLKEEEVANKRSQD